MALLPRTWSVYPSARGSLRSAAIDVGSHTFKAVLLSDSYTPGSLGATQRSDVAAYALGTDQTVSLSNSSGVVSIGSAVSWSGSLSPRYVAVYDDTHASDALVCVADLGGVNGPGSFTLPAQTLFTFDELVASSAEPWYEQTWGYGEAGQLSGPIPNNTLEGVSRELFVFFSGGEGRWDNTADGIDPTGSQSFRVTFDASGSDGGVSISLPESDQDQPKEIWHEQWIKYAADWEMNPTSCSNSPTNGHKTIFWFTQETTAHRHEFHIGQQAGSGAFGQGYNQLFNPRTDRAQGRLDTDLDDIGLSFNEHVWDGQWHRWRFYLNRGANGVGGYKVWFDDHLIHDRPNDEPFPLDTDNPNYWDTIALSRNMNCSPADAQSMWFGRTRIYTTDPGW